MGQPSWDAYFMGMVFLACVRSPDRETKQGCVIACNETKRVMATGYNGHPAGAVEYYEQNGDATYSWFDVNHYRPYAEHKLATTRPEKYAVMAHADQNAAAQAMGTGEATCYLPMPPCERCLIDLNQLRLRGIRITRIVYLEDRDFPNTRRLLRHLPHIKLEKYAGRHPADVLLDAATYARLRTDVGGELSRESTTTYCQA